MKGDVAFSTSHFHTFLCFFMLAQVKKVNCETTDAIKDLIEYLNMSPVTLSKMGNFTLVMQVMHESYCSHKKWAQKSMDLHVLNASTTQRGQK